MNYESKFQDSMICIDSTWIRASRIEAIWTEPSSVIGQYRVTVKMFSGHTVITESMPKGEAEKIARMAVGTL